MTGSAIYGFSLAALMYGFSSLFVRWELNVRNPVLDMHLFRNNTVFSLSTLAALINYSATFAVAFFLTIYLRMKGLSPQNASLIFVSQPIMMTIFSPVAGWLSDTAGYSMIFLKLIEATANIIASKSIIAAISDRRLVASPLMISPLTASTA